jgi:hypothetical protein
VLRRRVGGGVAQLQLTVDPFRLEGHPLGAQLTFSSPSEQ